MKYLLCLLLTFFSFLFFTNSPTYAVSAGVVDVGGFEMKIDAKSKAAFGPDRIAGLPQEVDLVVRYTIKNASGNTQKVHTAKMQRGACQSGYTNCILYAPYFSEPAQALQVDSVEIDWGSVEGLKGGSVRQTQGPEGGKVFLGGTTTGNIAYTWTPSAEQICASDIYAPEAAYIVTGTNACKHPTDCVAKVESQGTTCWPVKLSCNSVKLAIEPSNPITGQEVKLKLSGVDAEYNVFMKDSGKDLRRNLGKVTSGQTEFPIGKFQDAATWKVGLEKIQAGGPQTCTDVSADFTVKSEAQLSNPALDTNKAAKVCGDLSYTTEPGPYDHIPEGVTQIKFTFSGPKIVNGTKYSMKLDRSGPGYEQTTGTPVEAKDGKVTLTMDKGWVLGIAFWRLGTYKGTLYTDSGSQPVCNEVTYTIGAPNDKTCRVTVSPAQPKVGDKICLKYFNAQAGSYNIRVVGGANRIGTIDINNQGIGQKVVDPFGAPGNIRLGLESTVVSKLPLVGGYYCTSAVISVIASDGSPAVTDPQCADAPTPGDGNLVMGPTSVGSGIGCKGGVQTAIGCVPTEPTAFINGALKFLAGAGGGVALLLMISGSFQMITSGGSADQLKKGREQFIAALTGLLFIIFSITLLRIIGVDILQIPGFTK